MRATPSSFAGLEKAAKRKDAKGIYFERGPHAKLAEIAARGGAGREAILVAHPSRF